MRYGITVMVVALGLSGCATLGAVAKELDAEKCYDAANYEEFRACAKTEAENAALKAAWKAWQEHGPEIEDQAKEALAEAVREARKGAME